VKVHGPYRRQDGRQIVIVVENNGKRRTVSYPKWLMELQLGRKLDPDLETVDHMDSNFENNDIGNLRLVPRDQHSGDDTRRVKLVKFTCAWCDKEFERSPRLVRDKAKKNKAGPFCSRTCAGKYSRMLQLKLIDKMDTQPVIDSEYYKRKYVQASSPILSSDQLIDYICDIWPAD
jgi:HNH endonuclease/MYM-type Zinc finger with FCS sequence motif